MPDLKLTQDRVASSKTTTFRYKLGCCRRFAAIPSISSMEGESQPMPATPMDYIWPGIIAAQAIYAATKLRIPDLLAFGPRSVAELASDCDAHPPTLERLLRAL